MKLRKNASADGAVDEAAPASRKGLLIGAGVAAGLAVVAGMGYVLISGGGDDTADSGVVASANHAPAAQATGTPTAAATAAPAIKKFNGKNARDPFKALVVEPVSNSAAATGTTTGTTAGTTSGTSANPTTPASSPTTAPTSPTHVSSAVTIKMVSVGSSNSTANLTVDAKPFNGVKPNEEFGEHFKLLNLHDGKCGAVQYGDVTFDLCEGKSLSIG